MLSAAASSAGGDIGDDWGAAGAAPDTAPEENAWDADAGDAGGAGDKEFSSAGFDDFGTDWAAGDDGSATVSDPASADLGTDLDSTSASQTSMSTLESAFGAMDYNF